MSLPIAESRKKFLIDKIKEKGFKKDHFTFPLQRTYDIDITKSSDLSPKMYLINFLKGSYEYFFKFEKTSDPVELFNLVYSPSGNGRFQHTIHGREWTHVTRLFESWLSALKIEFDAQIENKKSDLDLNEFSDFKFKESDVKNFTPEEKISFKKEFAEIKELIYEIADMTADELKIMTEELNNIQEKIDLLNKPDTLKFIYGTMTGYIPKVVSNAVVKEAWRIFKEKFNTDVSKLLE